MVNLHPIMLSMEVALLSTSVVLVCGVACAYGMRRWNIPGKAVIEALITLPLVLPPIVTGFLLLVLLGKQGPFGQLLERHFHSQIVFTPYAAVIAGIIVSLPLMYQSAKAALGSVGGELEDAARSLGASELRLFWTVTVPLAWPGLVSGIVLSFARALGEFGATIMVAGNIPGQTQTMSLAIYFAAESSDYMTAGIYALVISIVTFAAVFSLSAWQDMSCKKMGKAGA